MEKKKVVVIGAGRSATHLIEYLIALVANDTISLVIADISVNHWNHVTGANLVKLDIQDEDQVKEVLSNAFCVISMVPADYHIKIVRPAVQMGVHAFTPSYLSREIQALDELAKSNNVLVLNEMGVDPGIDHMSALSLIHKIRSRGFEVISFESYTGGLVATHADNNKWGYKISWNPRNIVLAGSAGHAMYLENGLTRMTPYQKLFRDIIEIQASDGKWYEGYPNRNSLNYVQDYGLDEVLTLKRGTLRSKGFSRGWNYLVNAGFTNDSSIVPNSIRTWNDLSLSLLGGQEMQRIMQEGELYDQLSELGIFSNIELHSEEQSCAMHLQNLLERNWKLEPGDSDKIVMVHRVVATSADQNKHEFISSFVIEGKDAKYTAMSKAVGMPIAFAVKRLLDGELKNRGVLLPTLPEIYEPILSDLKSIGISFVEKEMSCVND